MESRLKQLKLLGRCHRRWDEFVAYSKLYDQPAWAFFLEKEDLPRAKRYMRRYRCQIRLYGGLGWLLEVPH